MSDELNEELKRWRDAAVDTIHLTDNLISNPEQATSGSGLRKIADAPQPCRHPEHDPPGMIVLEPGIYEHTCPGCNKKTRFTVGGTYL